MKSMTQTLEQLRKDKQDLDDTIAVLEQLSRQLEKSGKAVEPQNRRTSEDTKSKTGKAARR